MSFLSHGHWGYFLGYLVAVMENKIHTNLVQKTIIRHLPSCIIWCFVFRVGPAVTHRMYCSLPRLIVPSVQQKSITLKFSKSRIGSDMTYSCHHNSSRFTFPIFLQSWRFCAFHSLQSI